MGILKNQRGVILMATIILLMFMLMLVGITADFMRAFLIKRELQDSIDAAVISATQIDSTQQRSNYEYEKGQLVTPPLGHSYCTNYKPYWVNNVVSTSNPLVYVSGPCVQYIGEQQRWVDYTKGTDTAQSVAQSIYNYNISHSRILNKNAQCLSGTTATFTVYNNQADPRYPSVTGEVNATLKTTFLAKIISPTIPIICKTQATTHYEDISNFKDKGLHSVPADVWGTYGVRSMTK